MSDALVIQSHRGPYSVDLARGALRELAATPMDRCHFIIDANVASLYRDDLAKILNHDSLLVIEATEAAKTIDRFTGYVEALVAQSVRRDHRLVAIGGGIIQDITAFLATTLLRGMRWIFYPTTLLAQADSCIGSKSSINVGAVKNILGTFCPPERIIIDPELLRTLSEVDQRSGIGEMLKVHAIAGPRHFDEIAAVYVDLQQDFELLQQFIRRSLEFKKVLIEQDEFDAGPRNVMNYGHSFGHALEAATGFAVPHGIAVTIGMDLANYVAAGMGRVSWDHYHRMHPVLMANSRGYRGIVIPLDYFFVSLNKDKKNIGVKLSLILPDQDNMPRQVVMEHSEEFRVLCTDYFFKVLAHV
ncbi:MAG: iron-containing alcohol dehydrogenase [Magnetococcus sp. YQC-5]